MVADIDDGAETLDWSWGCSDLLFIANPYEPLSTERYSLCRNLAQFGFEEVLPLQHARNTCFSRIRRLLDVRMSVLRTLENLVDMSACTALSKRLSFPDRLVRFIA
jgi:hypothetical protein